jgi:hypothetical protein
MFDFPNSPTTNQTITMPDGTVRKWDGTKWVAGQTPQGAYCSYGDTPPTNPAPGVLWWDTVSCQLFLWYNDGNSSQWVPAIAIPASVGEAPADSNIYGRINGGWSNLLAAASIQGNVGRNFVHNGIFTINQRLPGAITTIGYPVDRWGVTTNLDTISSAQVTLGDTARAAIGDESATFGLGNTFTGSATTGAYNLVDHHIEGVRRLANKTVTVSFWANSSVAAINFAANLAQNFGTGGSPSATVVLSGQKVVLSSTWSRYTLTFNLPSISGMTLGTNNNDYTLLRFWYSSTTTGIQDGGIGQQSGTINLWGVQLEIGNKATVLEKRDPMLELSLCQRYYQGPHSMVISGYGSTVGGGVGQSQLLPVKMRATPTSLITANSCSNVSAVALTPLSGSAAVWGNGTNTAVGGWSFNIGYTLTADI